MKVVIAGCRDFFNYQFVEQTLDKIFQEEPFTNQTIEIVSGNARGVDILGEKYAQNYNLPVHRFPAQWDKFGKAAGPIRNKRMAEIADYVIVFWDGRSRGTKNMIETCQQLGVPCKIVYI